MKKQLLKNSKVKKSFILVLFVIGLIGKTNAAYFWQAASIISFNGSATYVQNATANPLVLTIQQCAGGISLPNNSTVYNQSLYINNVNSTTGGTLISTNVIGTPALFAPSYSYTPSTATVGTFYYYYLLTSPSMTTCGFTGTLTSPISTVVVNAAIPGEALNFVSAAGADNVFLPQAISTNSLVGNNKVSVEAWVRPTSLTGLGVIVGNYSNPSNQLQFLLRRENGNYGFWVGPGNVTTYLSATSAANTATLNTWQHVAGVYNGTVISIYINGVLSSTAAASYTFAANTNSILIGSNGINESFDGDIDELRIWNSARTKCEINTYKNCEIPSNAANLISNYHFNQGVATAVNTTVTNLTDATSNGFNGTLNTFALTGATSNWTSPGGVVAGFTTALAPVSLTVTAIPSLSVCSGNTLSLSGSGANTYAWTNGITNAVAFTPTASAAYNVTGTNTITACTASAVANVVVNTTPTVSVNNGTICSGNAFTISPSGASTYSIQSGNAVVSPSANANYTVTGTSAAGCVSANTATSNVTVNASPTVSTVSNASLICTGQSATLTASGANTYTWNTSGTAANEVVTPSVSTTYTVNGTAANGCSSSAIITQSVSACTGIGSVNNTVSSLVSVYPNPNNGAFTISLNSACTVIIINNIGQVVSTEKLEVGNHNLNISSLSNGVYMIQAISNGQQHSLRMIKQ